MKIYIGIFLTIALLLNSSCKKTRLKISCDNPIIELDRMKTTLIGEWKLIKELSANQIETPSNDVRWTFADTSTQSLNGDKTYLREIDFLIVENNDTFKNEQASIIYYDKPIFDGIPTVAGYYEIDICQDEFVLTYYGKGTEAQYFERVR